MRRSNKASLLAAKLPDEDKVKCEAPNRQLVQALIGTYGFLHLAMVPFFSTSQCLNCSFGPGRTPPFRTSSPILPQGYGVLQVSLRVTCQSKQDNGSFSKEKDYGMALFNS